LRTFSKKHFIPIFDIKFEFIISDNARKTLCSSRMAKLIGKYTETAELQGMACYGDRNLVIILSRDKLSHSLIAHEVRHATDMGLTINGIVFGSIEREVPALLQEYLAKLIYKDIASWKIRLKP
jgi:hypothetical protein